MFKQNPIQDMTASEFADFSYMVYKFNYESNFITFNSAFSLWRYANELHYIALKDCNFGLRKQDELRRDKLEFLITNLLAPFDCSVEFNRDPRAYSVKITLNKTIPTAIIGIGDCEYNEREK